MLILSGVLISPASFASSASSKIGHALTDVLGRALVDVGEVTRQLIGLRPDSPEADRIIRSWESRHIAWKRIALVDASGTVTAVAPDEQGAYVGRSIASAAHWRSMAGSAAPAMGPTVFDEAEGAYDVLFPVFAEDGAWIGAVCVIIDPASVLKGLLDSVSEKVNARVEVMALDGTLVYGSDHDAMGEERLSHFAGTTRSSVHRIFTHMLGSESGLDSYYAFAPGDEGLEERRIEWAHAEFMGHVWVVSLEKGVAFVADTENPLTGRWVGAFSHRSYSVDGGAGGEAGSSQLSALILQDGAWCSIRASSPEWSFAGAGVYAHSHPATSHTQYTAQGGDSTWYWQGSYKAADDTLRGTIQGDARERIVEKTYYLRRVSGGQF